MPIFTLIRKHGGGDITLRDAARQAVQEMSAKRNASNCSSSVTTPQTNRSP